MSEGLVMSLSHSMCPPADYGGQVWRIGVMGNNARPEKIALLLRALGDALIVAGYTPPTTVMSRL